MFANDTPKKNKVHTVFTQKNPSEKHFLFMFALDQTRTESKNKATLYCRFSFAVEHMVL